MPVIIRCPSCQSRLRLPDHVGAPRAALHCPKCKQPIKPVTEAPSQTADPAPAPLAALQGIPVGILVRDDGVVVPLAPEERVRHPEAEQSRKRRKKRRSRQHRDPEPPPVSLPVVPPPSVPTAAAPPVDVVWSPDVEILPELDEPLEVAPLPLTEPAEAPSDEPGDAFVGGDDEERGDIQEWQSTRTGLLLSYVAGCLLLGAVNLALAGSAAAHLFRLCGAAGPAASIQSATLFLTALAGVAAGLLLVAGQVFCIFAPARSGAQILAAASAGLLGLSFFCILVGDLMAISGSVALFYGLTLTGVALAVAQPFFFLSYLRMLALTLAKRWLADDLRKVVFALAGSLVGYALFTAIALGIGAALAGRPAAAAVAAVRDSVDFVRAVGFTGVLVLAVGVALVLGIFTWGLKCLAALRDAIQAYTGTVTRAKVPAWLVLAVGAAASLGVLLLLCSLTYFTPPKTDAPDDASAPTSPTEFRERRLNSASPD